MKRYQRRIASMIVAISSAVVLTAEVALAGSGTGLIHFPNPAAPWAPGVTERSFKAEKCKRLPQDGAQGWDAWVSPLDPGTSHVVVSAPEFPKTSAGYTFHVVFYSHYDKADACHSHKALLAKGNPTQALETEGAEWVVISVLAGAEVKVAWKECGTASCSI